MMSVRAKLEACITPMILSHDARLILASLKERLDLRNAASVRERANVFPIGDPRSITLKCPLSIQAATRQTRLSKQPERRLVPVLVLRGLANVAVAPWAR